MLKKDLPTIKFHFKSSFWIQQAMPLNCRSSIRFHLVFSQLFSPIDKVAIKSEATLRFNSLMRNLSCQVTETRWCKSLVTTGGWWLGTWGGKIQLLMKLILDPAQLNGTKLICANQNNSPSFNWIPLVNFRIYVFDTTDK